METYKSLSSQEKVKKSFELIERITYKIDTPVFLSTGISPSTIFLYAYPSILSIIEKVNRSKSMLRRDALTHKVQAP